MSRGGFIYSVHFYTCDQTCIIHSACMHSVLSGKRIIPCYHDSSLIFIVLAIISIAYDNIVTKVITSGNISTMEFDAKKMVNKETVCTKKTRMLGEI